MASPLTWFRKKQKLLLCVFGVAIMLVFTLTGTGTSIVDVLTGGNSSGRKRSSPDERLPGDVVVKWSGGQLTENEIDNLRSGRRVLRQFMARVMALAQGRGGQPEDFHPLPDSDADASLLELSILSREADRLGVTINDEAVVDYLNQQTGGTVSTSDFETIINEMNRGGGTVTDAQMFALLAREIKAHKMRAMVRSGGYPASPLAAWDHFNRLQRRIEAELLPIRIDDYVSKVDEPTQDEVASLYDEFKNRYSNPANPDPGFKQRERRAFAYLRVDYEKFLEEEKPKISADEVKEYYEDEANKEEFLKTPSDTDEATQTDDAPETDEAAQTDNATQTDDALETDEAPVTDEATQSGNEKQPENTDTVESTTTENDTTTEKPAEESAPDRTPDTESPAADDTTLENTADDSTADDSTADDGEVEQPAPTPTALPQVEQTPALEPATTADSDTPPSGESADATATPQETDQETLSPEATESAEEPATAKAPAEEAPAETQDDSSTSDDAAPTQEITDLLSGKVVPAAEKEYQTLEEATDVIRTKLARPIAQQRVDEVLSKARGRLEEYFRTYTLWDIDAMEDPDAPQPPAPDLTDMADSDKVQFGKIPPSDILEVSSYELGQSYRVEVTPDYQYRPISFVSIAYRKEFSLFKVETIPSAANFATTFMFWMTDRRDEYVPKLEDIRDQVVAAVKRKKAFGLLIQAAEAEVTKAKKSPDEPISVSLGGVPGREFLKTGEITQMVGGVESIPQANLRIPGVDYAGLGFLEALFGGDEGDIGIAVNAPKTMAYVFRIDKVTPAERLRDDYLRYAGGMLSLRYVAETESMMALRDWYSNLTDRYAIDWVRDPENDSRLR